MWFRRVKFKVKCIAAWLRTTYESVCRFSANKISLIHYLAETPHSWCGNSVMFTKPIKLKDCSD